MSENGAGAKNAMPWKLAAYYSMLWAIGGALGIAVVAGLLNGLSLVDGRDDQVAAAVIAIGAPLVFVCAGAYHRTWRVPALLLLWSVPLAALAALAFVVWAFSGMHVH